MGMFESNYNEIVIGGKVICLHKDKSFKDLQELILTLVEKTKEVFKI